MTRRWPLTFISRQNTAAPTWIARSPRQCTSAGRESSRRIPRRAASGHTLGWKLPGGKIGELVIAEIALRQRPARLAQLRGLDIDTTRRGLAQHAGIGIDPQIDTLSAQYRRKGLRGGHIGQCDQ